MANNIRKYCKRKIYQIWAFLRNKFLCLHFAKKNLLMPYNFRPPRKMCKRVTQPLNECSKVVIDEIRKTSGIDVIANCVNT